MSAPGISPSARGRRSARRAASHLGTNGDGPRLRIEAKITEAALAMKTTATDLGAIIRDLHDSEINGRVEWFYDDHWSVAVVLGDDLSGIDAEDVVASIEEAAEWLLASAVRLYPDSAFARKHRRGSE